MGSGTIIAQQMDADALERLQRTPLQEVQGNVLRFARQLRQTTTTQSPASSDQSGQAAAA